MHRNPPSLPPTLLRVLASSRIARADLVWVPPAGVPPPYQQLLVHDRDMTTALARFHGDSIMLEVLHRENLPDLHLREVVLRTSGSGRPVEYGLIEILLSSFPAAMHPAILAGITPLGTLLNESGLAYRSIPQGFFFVQGRHLHGIFSNDSGGKILFGRYNHLVLRAGPCLARIFEILPDETTQP